MQKNETKQESGLRSFYERMTNRADAIILSDSKYNLYIGLMLAYAFVLNFLLAQYVAPPLVRSMIIASHSTGIATYAIIGIVLYFVLCLLGGKLLYNMDERISFIGYNLIALPVGIVLSIALYEYDPELISRALLYTSIIVIGMMVAATFAPNLFARMGSGLLVSLGITILVEGISMIFFRDISNVVDYIVVTIMALFVGFDWVRANAAQKTRSNAIIAAASLYLDIVNILLRVLRILARSKSSSKD